MNLNNLTSLMPDTAHSASKNILSADVDIKGTLHFENEMIFDGKIEGEILSDSGSLTLGKNANVQGEIKTKSVVIHGTVVGNITITERAELKASSQLTGDLSAQRIIIEEGATFVGKSQVTPNRSSSVARGALPVTSESARKAPQPAQSLG